MAFEVRLQIFSCLFITLLHIYPSVSRTTKLFGADPAGGLWGVQLNTAGVTSAKLLSGAGYPQSLFDKQIATASYDPLSGKVLLETSNPRSLYYGPLCGSPSEPPRLLASSLSDFTISVKEIGDCVGCEASAFTMYDSKIYFLLNGEFVDEFGDYSRLLQIRVFQPCDQCQMMNKDDTTEYSFQFMVSCSKVLVNVISEYIDDEAQIKAGKHMKIADVDGTLSFFFQTGNITMSDSGRGKASMALWHADMTGDAHVLFDREIANAYGKWNINSQGAIDFKDGMLCWTYPDTVFCGDLIGHTLRRGAVKLQVAAGVIAGVCTGESTENLHIISGVAVSDSGADRSFVFGCYPQEAGTGGTGIMGKDDENPLSIKVGEDRMMAGSVFIVDNLPDTCNFEPNPEICLGVNDPKPEAEEPDAESEPESNDDDDIKGDGDDDKKQSDSSDLEKEAVSEGDEVNDDKQSNQENGTKTGESSSGTRRYQDSTAAIYLIMSILTFVLSL
jgi:hypothetical protein